MTRSEKIFFTSLFFLSILSVAFIYGGNFNSPPIRSDGIGYYSFLPSIFIHKDADMKSLVEERFEDEEEVPKSWGGIREFENGKYIDKYPIGIAIMMFPFFAIAHILTLLSNLAVNIEVNGFTPIYQLAIGFSGIFYFICGVYILKKILDKYFGQKIVYTTLLCIIFGTNLFHYGTYDSGFSHAYMFFLFSALIYQTIEWYKKLSFRNTLILGVISGLIIAVRPTNFYLLLFIPLYDINTLKDILQRMRLFLASCFLFPKRSFPTILVFTFCILLLITPQLLYFHFATGKFIAFLYEDQEKFNFLDPQIANVLFSVRKGLFFWSPVLLFSIPGIILMRKRLQAFFVPTIVILLTHIYIVSSWWHWPYGGSFGHRAFVDVMPLFAIALAVILREIFKLKNPKLKVFIGTILWLLVLLAVKNMFQYWINVVLIDGTTWDYYLDHFFSLSR